MGTTEAAAVARLPGVSEIDEAAKVVYAAMPPTPEYSWPQINARAGEA